MEGPKGSTISSFKDLEKVKVNHFNGKFKGDGRATIDKVVKMATFFPNFVYEV